MEISTPRARRLNRRAAIAAALVACGITLVVGALVTSTPRVGDQAQPLPESPETQSPTFLDRAPVPPPVEPHASLAELLGGGSAAIEPAGPREPGPEWAYAAADPHAAAYPADAAEITADPQSVARERAVTAGILVAGQPGEAAPIGFESGEAPREGVPPIAERSRLLAAEVVPAGSGYEVAAGTALHAVLVTAVDSDSPGDAVAMLTHDVYDRAMREVLIPRTSRLLGRPAGGAVMGQRRLRLVWDRLVMPDGRTVLLPEIPSQDASGAAAHAARVDNHTGALMRSALLLSLVGSAAQLSQPQQSATWGQAPSVGQTMAGAAGAQLAQTSGEMIRRGMDVRPTLSLPQGTQLNVLLTADLALEPYR